MRIYIGLIVTKLIIHAIKDVAIKYNSDKIVRY